MVFYENKHFNPILNAILIVYTIAVLYFTLFWRTSGFIGAYTMHLNVIPFYWIIEPLILDKAFYLSQVVLNVLLFVPLGFLIPCIWAKANVRNILKVALIATLSIEFLQPLFGRTTDIDDVILNVLGGAVGYFMQYAVVALFCRIILNKTSLTAHIPRSVYIYKK